jgi:GntR family transcriptional regulator, trigonelline degradation regulator
MLVDQLKMLEPPLLVRERAFEEVRNAIISGELAPGTRLIERELCAAMGISRASVREMVRLLQAERLIDVEPRRGPTVATLSRKQAAEIYEIRGMMESLLIQRFTEHASDADIEALLEIFAQVKAAAADAAPKRIVALMLRFNEHLMTVARHEIACEILDGLNARISSLRLRAMSKPGRTETSLGELRAVLDAVARRDAEQAAQLMRVSVDNARDAALDQLPE